MNVKKKVILIVLMSIMFYLLIFMSNNKVYADSEDIVISKNYDISQAVNKSCNVIVNEIYEATVVNESTVATSLKEISLNIYGTGKMRDNPFSGFKNESISLGSRGGSTNLMSFNNVTVQIQFGVVNIGAGAFEGFQIKSLSIYDSVTSIGSNAFLNCINLKELSMSNNITEIGEGAFKNCTALETLDIPDKVTKIGGDAFNNCTNLKTININKTSNLESIGNTAFDNCLSLESIYLPSKISSMPSYNNSPVAFSGCSSLKSINVDENNKIYSSEDGILFNKDKTRLIKYPINMVKGYWAGPIYQSYVPNSYTIPDTVTTIGYGAFTDVTNLKVIIIPNSVTSLLPSAFSGTGITSIELPESIKTIGITAFARCKNLEYVKIPSTINNIDLYAFRQCTNLKKVIIPESVTNIHSSNPFEECEDVVIYCKVGTTAEQYAKNHNIEHILYNESGDFEYAINANGTITIIGYNGTAEEIEVPNKIDGKIVTELGDKVFYNKTNLKKITLPEGITNIGNYTFENCISLVTINIPATVRTIGKRAFNGCTDLTDIIIPEGVNTINEGTFSGCMKLSNIRLPNTITSIGDDVFSSCMAMKEFIVPDGVVAIGSNTFYQCLNLEKIRIPESVVSFGENIFDKVMNFTIECYKGSKAEEYAKQNNINYKLINSSINPTEPEDKMPPEVTVSYSTTTPTKESVTVTITANEEIQGVEGWTLSADKKKLTKTYSSNKEETVIVKDLAGNQTTVKVKIENITDNNPTEPEDKTPPEVTVSYSTTAPTKESVTVIITANEEIQGVEGWTLSADKKKLTKTYSSNKEETVIVKDLAGNQTTVKVKIENITDNNPTEPEDKTPPEVAVSYSTTAPTKESVTATITANEEIQGVEGWTLSADKRKLTKTYSSNKEETVIVKDLSGNKTETTIKINNITKDEKPNTDVSNGDDSNNSILNGSGSAKKDSDGVTKQKEGTKIIDSKAQSILPKTGVGKVASISALIGIILSIVFYVKYKKTY